MRLPPPIAAILTCLTGCDAEPQSPTDAEFPPTCAPGWIADGDTCVPESCGTDAWGGIEVDGNTVFVDAAAPHGGDGSEATPLTTIQPALDLAGSNGGGLVAVAAGTYAETLLWTSDSAGVRLAGRCRELVILDASVGDGRTPGIDIGVLYGEVELSGLTVRDSSYGGVVVASGVIKLERMALEGGARTALTAYRAGSAPTVLEVSDCLIERNSGAGVVASTTATEVSLANTTIRDTLATGAEESGYGVLAYGGAALQAEGCVIEGTQGIGLWVSDAGTEVSFDDTIISGTSAEGIDGLGYGALIEYGAVFEADGCTVKDNTRLGIAVLDSNTEVTLTDTRILGTVAGEGAELGYGIEATEGARLAIEGCALEGNTVRGLRAHGPGTEVSFVGSTVRGTRPDQDGEGGGGISVYDGAKLTIEGSLLEDNTWVALLAHDPGTEVALSNSTVRDPHHEGGRLSEAAIIAYDGVSLEAVGCELADNIDTGIEALGAGTRVTLVDSVVRNTLPAANGLEGYGIVVSEGATASAEGCLLERNTSIGIAIDSPGTELLLLDSSVRDTRLNGDGLQGYGIAAMNGARLQADNCAVEGSATVGTFAHGTDTEVALTGTWLRSTSSSSSGQAGVGLLANEGARLLARSCLLEDTTGIGIGATDPGTGIVLVDTTVRDTLPDGIGEDGYGIVLQDGASLSAEGCTLVRNSLAGILVTDPGTHAEINASSISGTKATFGVRGASCAGLVAQSRASVAATGLLVQGTEGPGLHATEAAGIACTGCSLLDNRFAGAMVQDGGWLELLSSRISGTTEGADIGGGAGLHAARLAGWEPSSMLVSDCDISDNLVAGAWLHGEGAYRLERNAFSDNVGVPHGVGIRCGDGVYAVGTTTWDDSSGLLLDGNTITENAGAGLLLDDAEATLDGNTWGGNNPDLLIQGEACLEPPEAHEDAPNTEVCPAWDRPTCELRFSLNLNIVDIEPALPPPPAVLTFPSLAHRALPVSTSTRSIPELGPNRPNTMVSVRSQLGIPAGATEEPSRHAPLSPPPGPTEGPRQPRR